MIFALAQILSVAAWGLTINDLRFVADLMANATGSYLRIAKASGAMGNSSYRRFLRMRCRAAASPLSAHTVAARLKHISRNLHPATIETSSPRHPVCDFRPPIFALHPARHASPS
ncbi:MAG: hypothetical protein JJU42_14365 [Rhodobacteraceae bacterium]|nr:hypothetical protein [Paracoccaceae bacterium]